MSNGLKTFFTNLANVYREASGSTDKVVANTLPSLFGELLKNGVGGGSEELVGSKQIDAVIPGGRYNISYTWLNGSQTKYTFYTYFRLADQKTVTFNNAVVGTNILFATAISGAPSVKVTVTGDLEVLVAQTSGVMIKITGPNGGTITIADA